MTNRPPDIVPQIRLEQPLSADSLEAALPSLITAIAKEALPRQRWFGDKTRELAAATVADTAIVPAPGGFWILLLADLAFAGGPSVRYFMPLAALTAPSPSATAVAALASADETVIIVDALTDERFRAELLSQLDQGAQFPGRTGTFAWQPDRTGDPTLTEAAADASRVITAEQSNSSVMYGERLILKVFRKVQPGVNPEIEIGRFLAHRTPFRHTPVIFGDLVYTPLTGTPTSLAVAESYVPNRGDGWGFTLDCLRDETEPSRENYRAAADLLGRRTGQMHMALASDINLPGFAPEPIDTSQAAAWRAATLDALAEVESALTTSGPARDPLTADLVRRFQERLPALRQMADGYNVQIGTTKTRVHGDFHLGQTLRTIDDDFAIIDFEGEPARPLAERQLKTSPLKDVAGMLRSLSYAQGAAARAGGNAGWLDTWEASARTAFLAGYMEETVRRGASFVPAESSVVAIALAAWELDKALYEIRYELNHRPDWLPIPLGALVR